MGKIRIPPKAKLFCAIFSGEDKMIEIAIKSLEKEFGQIDFKSEFFDFSSFSAYYEEEMGKNIKKMFMSFENLVKRERIVDIKLFTNRLEFQLSGSEIRKINIDPGYLTLSNIVLATTKDYQHRIYIKDGIYLENTLRYSANMKQFIQYEWTYPDYRMNETRNFFKNVREKYKLQLKS